MYAAVAFAVVARHSPAATNCSHVAFRDMRVLASGGDGIALESSNHCEVTDSEVAGTACRGTHMCCATTKHRACTATHSISLLQPALPHSIDTERPQ